MLLLALACPVVPQGTASSASNHLAPLPHGLAPRPVVSTAPAAAPIQSPDPLPKPLRVVWTFTTTAARINYIKPVLDAIIELQSRPIDRAYLATPPNVTYPEWLRKYDSTSRRPGVLHCLRMAKDYGPASKLLAALREGGERDPSTVVIWGDDDVYYGSELVTLHLAAQAGATRMTAFAPRLITLDSGTPPKQQEQQDQQAQQGALLQSGLLHLTENGIAPADDETVCMCDSPGQGAAGHNTFKCMHGTKLNESRSCGSSEECHSRLPARYGDWGKLCRVPTGPNAPVLLVEGTGTVSVRASVALLLPETVFAVGDEPDACRLSDDFWISHFFHRANISLEGLPNCRFDYEWESYDEECGFPFYELEDVGGINALSSRGRIESADDSAELDSGDFTDQFARYRVCRERVWGLEHPAQRGGP